VPDKAFTITEKTALRAWLKMLGTTGQMRKQLQARLMDAHGISLARFDVLANLYRAPKGGMRLSDLSKKLMVSNGNVTQVVAPLVRDGFIIRRASKTDARVATAELSEKGLTVFEAMAADHAKWVTELLSGASTAEQETITDILGQIGPPESAPQLAPKSTTEQ